MVHTDFGPPSTKYKEEPVDDSVSTRFIFLDLELLSSISYPECISFYRAWGESVILEESPAIDEGRIRLRAFYVNMRSRHSLAPASIPD
jgi:hypothetical protein